MRMIVFDLVKRTLFMSLGIGIGAAALALIFARLF
jgi:hypothetical protein